MVVQAGPVPDQVAGQLGRDPRPAAVEGEDVLADHQPVGVRLDASNASGGTFPDWAKISELPTPMPNWLLPMIMFCSSVT